MEIDLTFWFRFVLGLVAVVCSFVAALCDLQEDYANASAGWRVVAMLLCVHALLG